MTAEQRIAAVLVEHQIRASECTCRWPRRFSTISVEEHAAHVVAFVLAAVRPMLQAEALREAAVAMHAWARESADTIVADDRDDFADWLDARSDDIEAGR